MPRYDYQCTTCGTVKELSFSNWAQATKQDKLFCDCGGEFERKPSAGSFHIYGYNAANKYSHERQ